MSKTDPAPHVACLFSVWIFMSGSRTKNYNCGEFRPVLKTVRVMYTHAYSSHRLSGHTWATEHTDTDIAQCNLFKTKSPYVKHPTTDNVFQDTGRCIQKLKHLTSSHCLCCCFGVIYTCLLLPHDTTYPMPCRQLYIQVSQEERSIFWEVIVSVILSTNVYMNICPIPNGFQDRAIWMYTRKIVDKKEILRVRTVSNTGIYCSSDRVGTVYNKRSKIPPST